MSQPAATPSPQPLSPTELLHLIALEPADAVTWLGARARLTAATIEQIATAALGRAEAAPGESGALLDLADLLLAELNGAPTSSTDPAELASLDGQAAYARARWWLAQGDLQQAEASLRAAQTAWQDAQHALPLARSHMGLTQILAMQGRYAEAETIIQSALAQLAALRSAEPDALPLLAVARRNQATLYSVQDRHDHALVAYAAAEELLRELAALVAANTLPSDAIDPEPEVELAHLALNRAVSLMYLDRTEDAERALNDALMRFDGLQDRLNHGRTQTNLGALLLRTGRYGPALAAFDGALDDLLGPAYLAAASAFGDLPTVDLPDEGIADSDALGDAAEPTFTQLRQADILFLEQANAYLALNLLPEATIALERAEALFSTGEQPYELAQTLYARGLLALRLGALQQAESVLAQAAQRFITLGNEYWRQRSELARARVAFVDDRRADAMTFTGDLPMLTAAGDPPAGQDLHVTFEAELLRMRLALAAEADAATTILTRLRAALKPLGEGWNLPQIAYQVEYLAGRLAAQQGNWAAARSALFTAIEMIEKQRIALPFEEVRVAFLDDKAEVYDALIRILLDDAVNEPGKLAAAFDLVARAQSQTLLERMLATVAESHIDGAAADKAVESAMEEQRLAIYRALHWLYNRLLGGGDSSRSLAVVSRTIAAHEAALEQIERRRSPALHHTVAPATLVELQQRLAQDEQALVYHLTAHEAVVFVVERGEIDAVRLPDRHGLTAALREWRFQLGRTDLFPQETFSQVELRAESATAQSDLNARSAAAAYRRAAHLLRSAQMALAALHEALIAPVRHLLTRPRVLFIAPGPLHDIPFHALYDGTHYLLEEFICAYAPSVGVAAHLLRNACDESQLPFALRSFAGFALSEPAIPHTVTEVARAAAYFPEADAYVDAHATRARLDTAAQRADVLHLATHGLLRTLNPYFSALKLADGWQDVRSLYALDVKAALVVLSTCESGAGHVYGRGDLVGITRGFLGAGARRIVASFWQLHDASATRLIDEFYAALTYSPSAGPAAALRVAQLQAVARREHPYYWASFFAIE